MFFGLKFSLQLDLCGCEPQLNAVASMVRVSFNFSPQVRRAETRGFGDHRVDLKKMGMGKKKEKKQEDFLGTLNWLAASFWVMESRVKKLENKAVSVPQAKEVSTKANGEESEGESMKANGGERGGGSKKAKGGESEGEFGRATDGEGGEDSKRAYGGCQELR